LVHERYAPDEDPQIRGAWLGRLAQTQVSPDYADYFRRWQASLAGADSRCQTCRATSRLLVGHGNPSSSEVGLTVQHTWGAPVIPGSALKGMIAHHVAKQYGPEAGDDDPERAAWRGVTWTERRITRGPGERYRELFGAPDADADDSTESSACAGKVVFHDALYVPDSCDGNQPFARDVLTVHHKGYYDSRGQTAPNDYDDPIPVGFVNVRPGAQFLIAVSGPAQWADLAMKLLLEALDEEGVGGKTSLGYGRLVPVEPSAPEQAAPDSGDAGHAEPSAEPRSAVFQEFAAELKASWGREALADLLTRWWSRLVELDSKDRRIAASGLERKAKKLNKPRDADVRRSMDEAIAQLRADPVSPPGPRAARASGPAGRPPARDPARRR